MNASLKQRLDRLSLEDRLELVESLWAGIESTDLQPPRDPEHEKVLEARYEAWLRDPDVPTKSLKEIAAKLGIDL